MSENERETGGHANMQGVEVGYSEVDEFKYLRSTTESNGQCT